jgi:hypothetical protein
MLLRLLLLCVAAYAVVRLVRMLIGPGGRTDQRRVRSGRAVRCDSCGMFVDEGSAFVTGGKFFCSEGCKEGVARSRV